MFIPKLMRVPRRFVSNIANKISVFYILYPEGDGCQ